MKKLALLLVSTCVLVGCGHTYRIDFSYSDTTSDSGYSTKENHGGSFSGFLKGRVKDTARLVELLNAMKMTVKISKP